MGSGGLVELYSAILAGVPVFILYFAIGVSDHRVLDPDADKKSDTSKHL